MLFLTFYSKQMIFVYDEDNFWMAEFVKRKVKWKNEICKTCKEWFYGNLKLPDATNVTTKIIKGNMSALINCLTIFLEVKIL